MQLYVCLLACEMVGENIDKENLLGPRWFWCSLQLSPGTGKLQLMWKHAFLHSNTGEPVSFLPRQQRCN